MAIAPIADAEDFGTFLTSLLTHPIRAISERRTKQVHAGWCGLSSLTLASADEYKKWKGRRDRELKDTILPSLLEDGRIVCARFLHNAVELERLPTEPIVQWSPGDPDISGAEYVARHTDRFAPEIRRADQEVGNIYWVEDTAQKWEIMSPGVFRFDPAYSGVSGIEALDLEDMYLTVDDLLDESTMFASILATDRAAAMTWTRPTKPRPASQISIVPTATIIRDGERVALYRRMYPKRQLFDAFHLQMVRASNAYQVW